MFGLQGVSYAINVVEGATLAISDSCFAHNDFVGDGAVILDREEDLLSSSGNFGAADDNGVVCQFISIGGKCREYESTSCKVDPTLSAPSQRSDGSRQRRMVISLFASVALVFLW